MRGELRGATLLGCSRAQNRPPTRINSWVIAVILTKLFICFLVWKTTCSCLDARATAGTHQRFQAWGGCNDLSGRNTRMREECDDPIWLGVFHCPGSRRLHGPAELSLYRINDTYACHITYVCERTRSPCSPLSGCGKDRTRQIPAASKQVRVAANVAARMTLIRHERGELT